MIDYNKELSELFVKQVIEWPLVNMNYIALENVEERVFKFENCKIRLQHNPKRIISTGSKISKKDIQDRACFLCSTNRPHEQESIDYKGKYELLVNPFPIMPKHFTIASKEHIPQSIEYFSDMLSLARDLHDYSIVYNGAECGASAPDHMHFQAGSKDFIQTELEVEGIIHNWDSKEVLPNLIEYTASDYLRKTILIKSDNSDKIIEEFNGILASKVQFSNQHKDAKLNIICRFDDGVWTVIIFLRKAHRSSHYHRKNNILISPGVIDMGGVLICPRKDDYLNITKQDIIEIFTEVSL